MKEKLLVSACLLGENCKYSGGNNYSPADHPAGEGAVIDLPAAAGGAPLLEHRPGDPLGQSRLQGPLRPQAEGRRHVGPVPAHHLLPGPLRGNPGGGQAPQNLRTHGNQLVAG